MTNPRILALLLGASLFAGCGDLVDDDDDSAAFVPFGVTSPDFTSDDAITHSFDCDQALSEPFSCDGPNPEITWEGVPDGTFSFALILDDISDGNRPHWAILNIPGELDGLAGAISGESGVTGSIPQGATELSTGITDGYLGPCNDGLGHYRWRLWALPDTLDVARYQALEDDPEAAFTTLAEDADDARLDRTETCNVYDGTGTPVGR